MIFFFFWWVGGQGREGLVSAALLFMNHISLLLILQWETLTVVCSKVPVARADLPGNLSF